LSEETRWIIRKKHFLERLELEYKIGRVDADIKPLLDVINSFNEYYTTSSCSGRIQITLNRLPGDKQNIITVAKWHREVKVEEVLSVVNELKESATEYSWFSVQPPIFHVVARDVEAALNILNLARHCGFKHSGIQSVKKFRVVVEITGSERIEVPLFLEGVLIVKLEHLPVLVKIANELLLKSKEKMRRLQEMLLKERFN